MPPSPQLSLFGLLGKGAVFARRGAARPVKLMGLAVEQVPLKDKVTASLASSERSGLTIAEVRSRPFCALSTLTCATVSTPHFTSNALVKPAADIHANLRANLCHASEFFSRCINFPSTTFCGVAWFLRVSFFLKRLLEFKQALPKQTRALIRMRNIFTCGTGPAEEHY